MAVEGPSILTEERKERLEEEKEEVRVYQRGGTSVVIYRLVKTVTLFGSWVGLVSFN